MIRWLRFSFFFFFLNDLKVVYHLREKGKKKERKGETFLFFIDITGEGSLSMNWPKEARAQKLARKFVSFNPFFTVSIKPFNLEQYKMEHIYLHIHMKSYSLVLFLNYYSIMQYVPDLKSYIGNTKIVMLQVGENHGVWSCPIVARSLAVGACLQGRMYCK